jgi:type II secretory pathway pseudopilin PulG
MKRTGTGLTVVECLLAIVLLAATLLAVISTVTAGQQHVAYADQGMRAVRLAQDLLEEITARAYSEPNGVASFGPEVGESARSEFDDLDDYDSYAEEPGSLADFRGERYGPQDQACRRSVTVADASQDAAALGTTITGRTVTVLVQGPKGEQWEFSRFIPEPSAP